MKHKWHWITDICEVCGMHHETVRRGPKFLEKYTKGNDTVFGKAPECLIPLSAINMAGLSEDVIKSYLQGDKCIKYLADLANGNIFPPLEFYREPKDGLYTLADGIHRLCCYISLGITEFHYKLVKSRS